MKLQVNSNYRERSISYGKGDVIEVDDAEGERLIADSPGTFKRVGGSANPSSANPAPEGSSPRHTELLQMKRKGLNAIGLSLGINTKVFGMSNEELIALILEAEASGVKAPDAPPENKMIEGAPEQK